MQSFEPLVIGIMQHYVITHNTKEQKEILEMLTSLVHLGIEFPKLDKGGVFLTYVSNQILGKKSYLKNPPKMLSYLFNFFNAISLESSQLIEPANLLKLTSCVFSAPYWKTNGELIPTIKYLVKDLFKKGNIKKLI